jgi:hypothetical protein
VSFPVPHPGLVIRYSYLWKREQDMGREDGSKDRPCAVLLAVLDDAGERQVLVLPITHTPPANAQDAVEIPAATKTRLGLGADDGERSWIVISEANEFIWPGPDLRTVPGRSLWNPATAFVCAYPRQFPEARPPREVRTCDANLTVPRASIWPHRGQGPDFLPRQF